MSSSDLEGRADAPQEWALLDRVLDGAPFGIVVLDRELRFLRVNTRAVGMLGVDEREHAGRRLKDVLPDVFAELKGTLDDVIRGASHVAVETSVRARPSEPPRLYLASYYPLRAEDASVIGVGCIFLDITEQRVAEGALRDSEAQRRTILGHMLGAEEAERTRIALALHDDTIQVLCALLLMFDAMIPIAAQAGQDTIVARLGTARVVLSDATDRARKLMFKLHPNVLGERGLRAAITAVAEEVGAELSAEWSVEAPDTRYGWALEELAYRVVREALTNVRKHSHAQKFSVTLVEHGGTLSGVVQDHGRGLSRDTSIRDPLHLGVDSMIERARLAGGVVTVNSAAGKGVRVDFSFPVDPLDRGPATRALTRPRKIRKVQHGR